MKLSRISTVAAAIALIAACANPGESTDDTTASVAEATPMTAFATPVAGPWSEPTSATSAIGTDEQVLSDLLSRVPTIAIAVADIAQRFADREVARGEAPIAMPAPLPATDFSVDVSKLGRGESTARAVLDARRSSLAKWSDHATASVAALVALLGDERDGAADALERERNADRQWLAATLDWIRRSRERFGY
jgi:hypothetical protein